MPKAGGVYFYLDRAFGPMAGAIAGLGSWISLTLKTSFALVGSGYYIKIFMPEAPMLPIAIGLAILFGTLNVFGAGKTTKILVVTHPASFPLHKRWVQSESSFQK